VTRTYAIETKEEELKVALDELQRKVFSGEEKLKFLQDQVRKVTSILDQLVAAFALYRVKVVELQYLIAYLTGKLMERRKAFQESGPKIDENCSRGYMSRIMKNERMKLNKRRAQ
jgi:hypothetical protein